MAAVGARWQLATLTSSVAMCSFAIRNKQNLLQNINISNSGLELALLVQNEKYTSSATGFC